jgi:hypothetical protein
MFRNRYFIRITLAILALAGSFFIYRSAACSTGEACASSATETISTEKKQEIKKKMGWETLSHQFFS